MDGWEERLERLASRLERLRADAPPPPELGPDGGTERGAAVAMVLRASAPVTAPEVLLMRRRRDPRDRWSGQISLPGGRREPGDRDLVHTARRETEEEVGVRLAHDARLVGCLPAVQAIARGERMAFSVTPFVFAETVPLAPVPGPEASEAFWFPLGRTRGTELDGEHVYRRDDGLVRRLPSWTWEGRVVWGMTFFMLRTLRDALFPGAD